MSIHNDAQKQKKRLKLGSLSHVPFLCLGSYEGMNVPAWRRPYIGYSITIPLALVVLLTTIVGLSENIFVSPTYLNTILLLCITIIAFFWGAGPSLFMLFLGTLLIVDLFIQPVLFGNLFPWDTAQVIDVDDIISTVFFLITGSIISIIVFQREKARIQARENELAFRVSQQQLEEFIGIICHELNTPLAGIQGNIQLAKRKLQKNILSYTEDQRIYHSAVSILHTLQYAERSVHMQARLVGDLLDAVRLQRNEFRVIRTQCNLMDIVENVVERYRQSTSTRIITLEHPQNAVIICGDPDRIDQVLSNFITNALKYSPEDKPISVKLTTDDKWARISIHDEGPGLSSEEHHRIWKRFYRVRNVEVQGDPDVPRVGLGIGLALCKAIVELHHGHVGIESSPGHGSTFWFTLPLHVENIHGKC